MFFFCEYGLNNNGSDVGRHKLYISQESYILIMIIIASSALTTVLQRIIIKNNGFQLL